MMDLRFNILNEHVSKFIVVESIYSHSGKKKSLNFNIDDYPKFKDRIKYIVIDKEPENLIKDKFDLSPRGIREMLNLNRPIYECTAAYGHFGRKPGTNGTFSWEKTDKTSIFKK